MWHVAGFGMHRFVEVVAAALAGHPVHIEARGREDPLPAPLPAGMRVLPLQGSRKFDPAGALPEVGLVLPTHPLEMCRQGLLDGGREHADAILASLAVADDDLVGGEVDVLHAQAAALEQAEAGPVEQDGHEPAHAAEFAKHGVDLLASEDDRQGLGPLRPDDLVEPRQVDTQHRPIEEEQGAQRLVLGGRRDPVLDGERGEKRADLRGSHLGRVPLAVEEDVPPDLGSVGFGEIADRRGRGDSTHPLWRVAGL